MSFFDHTDGDKPDWLIIWFPKLFLAGCVAPVVIFLLMALYFEVIR